MATPGIPPPSKSSTVAVWVLPHLIAYVRGQGFDTRPLRQLPGLRGRDFSDPDLRVSDATAANAWRLAQQITGDQALGLHVAMAIPKGALDLVEYAVRSSDTLRSGLDRLCLYGRVVSDRAAARLVDEGDALAVTWHGSLGPRVDFALAFSLRLMRECTGRALTPTEVRFAYPPPARLRDYKAIFRSPLLFNAPASQLLFDRRDMSRPFRSADAAIAAIVRRRLDKMLRHLPRHDETTAAQVRRVVIETLTGGGATADAVARELGTSLRTLHRRLREEGVSFRRIVDAIRSDLAKALLQDRSLGIAEVAFILGYSEPAAFYRSFRRWAGLTPLAYRQACRRA